jgi:hypothetical protein
MSHIDLWSTKSISKIILLFIIQQDVFTTYFACSIFIRKPNDESKGNDVNKRGRELKATYYHTPMTAEIKFKKTTILRV